MSINYTLPEPPNDYESVTEPSANVLTSTAYLFTDIFLNGLFKTPVIPIEGLNTIDIENFDPFVDYLAEHWQDVLKQDWRLLTTLSLGVLLILALPISAIVYCCVKCCCSKVGQAPKKGDRTLILSLGSVTGLGLILCWLAFAWTCGAKVEFDHHIHKGLIESINVGANDAQLYLNNLACEVSHLAKTDFGLLSEALENQIDQIGGEFSSLLNDTVDEIKFKEIQTNAKEITDFVTNSNGNLNITVEKLTSCSINAEKIAKQVTNFKEEEDHSLFENEDFCKIVGESPCEKFRKAKEDINCELATFENIIQAAKDILIGATLEEDVVVGIGKIPVELEKALDEILGFQQTFDSNYASIFKEQIDEIQQYAAEVSESIQNFTQDIQLDEITSNLTGVVNDTITDYYGYVSYAGLLTPLILIGIILAVLTLGLICGCAGKSGTTLSRTGGISMFSATMVTLVLGWIIWLLVTVFYLVGALTQEVGCTTLEDPVHSPYYTETQIPRFLDKMYQELLNTTESFDLNATLTGFKNGDSLYHALEVEQFFDLDEFDNWQESFNISEILDDVKVQIDEGVIGIVNAMNASLDEEQLTQLTNTLKPIVSGLNDAIDVIDTSVLINQTALQSLNDLLESMKTKLEESPNSEEFLSALKPIQNSVQAIVNSTDDLTRILDEAKNKAKDIIAAVTKIIGSDNLRANDENSLLDQIKTLLEQAITEVNDVTRNDILAIFDNQSKTLITTVDGFIQFSKNYSINDFGKTGPVYNIYRGVIVSLCDSTVNPFNAYWSGMGVILILLVPVMIISCILEPVLRRRGTRTYPNEQGYANPNSIMPHESRSRPSNMDNRNHPSQHIYEDLRPPSGKTGVTKYRPEDYFPGYAGKGRKNPLESAQIRRPTQAFHPEYRRSPSTPKGIGPDGRFIYEIPSVYRRRTSF
ncbi:hypothetical protein TCAL_12050 [Tigriopus californicus]|uniref:Uncharacterized protein n=1 Tax=Tigriopus californicus TaxID=6832 RepID=A0A553PLC3_TIGCA|nr:hypothetical protein TCAL_12050 [Tigriopus californicus]